MIPVLPSPLLLSVLQPFAVAFTCPTFTHALTLARGALLTSGRRTVTAALCAVGLGNERHFTTYHRVLNRAVWSPLALSRILLGVLVAAFLAPDAPLTVLIDGTLERRWGHKITLKGRYHDAVRPTSGHPVTTEGIHWRCLMLLVPSPWGACAWALPFLTIPTRSPALSQRVGKPHRTTPEYAQVLIRLVRRWHPDREMILVGDSTFAVARLGHTCHRLGVRLVSRLLLAAQLYDPVPLQPKGKPGVKPKKGPRQPKLQDRLGDNGPSPTSWLSAEIDWYAGQRLPLEVATDTALWHRDGEEPLPVRWVLLRDPTGKRDPFALFCTDESASMPQIIAWYLSRWQIEVTFEEVRAHLGFQTQRHWSARAVRRTAPCLLGLFSVVLLLAHHIYPIQLPTRQAAWYAKGQPTFIDALAAVRRHLWAEMNAPRPPTTSALANPPSALITMLMETAGYAA